MKLTGRLLGLAAALAAIAALAGCGGSGTSKAGFAKKADAACAQINKAHPPPPLPKNLKEGAAQAGDEVQIRNELDSKLRGLDVPSAAKKDVDGYNASTKQIIAAIAQGQKDASGGNQAKYNADMQQVDRLAKDREKVAVKLGFKTCGRKNPAQ
jgi:hypothetical protein